MGFEGYWHIYEMENWDMEYCNIEIQAFIKLNKIGSGEFQFGLVRGDIDGRIVNIGRKRRLEFTFEGMDEMDPICGRGWIALKSENELGGEFIFHNSDSSTFKAKRD